MTEHIKYETSENAAHCPEARGPVSGARNFSENDKTEEYIIKSTKIVEMLIIKLNNNKK